jgi:ribonuclease E
MKRMLFNATQAEELRVAIVDGQKLIDLDIESAAKEQRKSNIYKAVITRIEPSLEAAFVDYGAERHGFLPFKEVSRSYFLPGVEAGRARIQDALKVGQELIVQVEKDERGNKGAALTTYISLAGRYLVLMPNNPRGGGVSRRIEGEDRQELREVMDQLEVPGGMSLIARTAGIGRSAEELQWDLNYLLQLWNAIDGAAKSQSGAFLIYQESSLVIRAIRDYFHPEIGEILIDTDDIFEQAQQFMAHVMPATVSRVKRYHDDVPLFSRFQIEHQIESAYSRQVNLPSGGAVVIDHTEALVAVDVNSGRATKGSDIEETAFRTNCEAADEIARQLRLRDIGGIIVIDFIDMEIRENRRKVLEAFKDALSRDKTRTQVFEISELGLVEMTRKRIGEGLLTNFADPCVTCEGRGVMIDLSMLD